MRTINREVGQLPLSDEFAPNKYQKGFGFTPIAVNHRATVAVVHLENSDDEPGGTTYKRDRAQLLQEKDRIMPRGAEERWGFGSPVRLAIEGYYLNQIRKKLSLRGTGY